MTWGGVRNEFSKSESVVHCPSCRGCSVALSGTHPFLCVLSLGAITCPVHRAQGAIPTHPDPVPNQWEEKGVSPWILLISLSLSLSLPVTFPFPFSLKKKIAHPLLKRNDELYERFFRGLAAIEESSSTVPGSVIATTTAAPATVSRIPARPRYSKAPRQHGHRRTRDQS